MLAHKCAEFESIERVHQAPALRLDPLNRLADLRGGLQFFIVFEGVNDRHLRNLGFMVE